MEKNIKETTAQWDDVPMKVVGRRREGVGGLVRGARFLRMGLERNIRLPKRVKGVFRYRSHEEANL